MHVHGHVRKHKHVRTHVNNQIRMHMQMQTHGKMTHINPAYVRWRVKGCIRDRSICFTVDLGAAWGGNSSTQFGLVKNRKAEVAGRPGKFYKLNPKGVVGLIISERWNGVG